VLRQLAAAAHADGNNAFTYGLLYAIEHARMERVLRGLPHRLDRLSDEQTLAWLQPNPAPRRLAPAITPLRRHRPRRRCARAENEDRAGDR
jgi:hypothetical protein